MQEELRTTLARVRRVHQPRLQAQLQGKSLGLSFRVELPDLVTSENFGSTGCPKVRANSNQPLNFGLGRHILKPFDMVNAHTGRFVLMYSNNFYIHICPGKYGVCSG